MEKIKPDEIDEHIDMSAPLADDERLLHSNASSHQPVDQRREYMKLAAILLAILFGAYMHYTTFDITANGFMDSFMGVFFLTFAAFKLIGMTEFVVGFASYDIVAKKHPVYGYIYPFIQMFFALMYLFVGASRFIDLLVLVVSLVSAYGVLQALGTNKKFHCVCLGNIIKLPLSRISFIEDFGMGMMALVMLIIR